MTHWFREPTDIELGALYLLLGAFVVVATDAVVSLVWLNFVLISLIIVGVLIFFRIITFILALRANTVKQFWTRWAQLGFVAIIMVLIFGTNLDLALRVRLSERELYEKVQWIQRLSTDEQKQLAEQRALALGFFEVRVYKVDPQSSTVWFHTADGEDAFGLPSLMGGIVYSEQGHPLEIGETTYQYLYGPWWRWVQDI